MNARTKRILAELIEADVLSEDEMQTLYALMKGLEEYAESLLQKHGKASRQREVKSIKAFVIKIHPDDEKE